MFCPKCGQQQASELTRFCSRCGLAIGGLAEWLASPEKISPLAPAAPRRKRRSRGAKVMFVSAALVPVFFGLSLLVDHPGPLLILLTVFLAGLSWTLYERLFGEELPAAATQQSRPQDLRGAAGGPALPPAADTRMDGVGRQQARTAELASPPPSVTEHTTKLLESD